jgi:hypothetical protein
VVVSGLFDLRSPENREEFVRVLALAGDQVGPLKEGQAFENEEPLPESPPVHPSTLAVHLTDGEPMHLGLRTIHPQLEFSTVVNRPTEEGRWTPHCALCLQALKPEDLGWFVTGNDVSLVSLFSEPTEEDKTTLGVTLHGIPEALPWSRAQVGPDGLWIHHCEGAPPRKVSCRMEIALPRLMRHEP